MYFSALINANKLQDLNYNISNILILFGSFQGIILVLLLLLKEKFKRKSNIYLALLILAVSLSNFKICLIDIGTTEVYPGLKYLPIIWPFLIPVLLYFFVQYLTIPKYRPKPQTYLLFIPFAVNFVFQICLLVTYYFSNETLIRWDEIITGLNNIKEFSAIIFCLAILFVILKDLRKFESNLYNNYAELTGKSLKWLINLVIIILILWLLWAIPYLMIQIIGSKVSSLLYPLWIGMSIAIYWIGYSTISRDEIFEAPMSTKVIGETLKEKSDTSLAVDNHYERLLKMMNEDKLYTDPELNMNMLAEKMKLSNGYVSQIINQKEGKNFFEFINSFRVEEVKSKLKNSDFDHYSVLGIALESGFNSKSTFNAVFKKTTGKTPSSFRNN